MPKYCVSQLQNGKTVTYGNFDADNPKEAVNLACAVAKGKYPQYSCKIPFKVKEYGDKPQEVIYHG